MARKTVLLMLAFLCSCSFRADETCPSFPYPTVPARSGEICSVCGVPVSTDDVAFIVKGRRMPVMKRMRGAFLENPETYFKRKQVKSALFQEEFQAPKGVVQAGVSLRWFFAGLYILTALIFGGLSGYAAVGKGLPPISYFFIGFFLSALGYMYVLSRPSRAGPGEVPAGLAKVPITRAPVACSRCGNMNHPAAAFCALCKASLSPRVESEVSRAR
ncbi:MAG: hypothetical protein L0387_43460 [Acidobacteria bacterium]|nr:hypothetical protein [Acidobacteriota bacterium]